MKFIQKYPYIKESRTQPLSEVKFNEMLKMNCKNWSVNNMQIFRGVRDVSEPFKYINPSNSKRERESISNDNINIYAIIMKHSDKWSKFPKRYNSIIASNDGDIVSDYLTYTDNDESRYYIVIPFDNSIWGISPRNDVWFSYDREELGLNSLQEFNEVITNFLNSLNGVGFTHINTIEDLKNILSNIDWLNSDLISSKVKDLNEILKEDAGYEGYEFKKTSIIYKTLKGFENCKNEKLALLNILNSLPSDDFKLVKYGKNGFDNNLMSREFWSNDECLLIRSDYYEKLFNIKL